MPREHSSQHQFHLNEGTSPTKEKIYPIVRVLKMLSINLIPLYPESSRITQYHIVVSYETKAMQRESAGLLKETKLIFLRS